MLPVATAPRAQRVTGRTNRQTVRPWTRPSRSRSSPATAPTCSPRSGWRTTRRSESPRTCRSGAIWVAREGGAVVGHAQAVPHGADVWEVTNIAVADDRHGQGIGRALLDAGRRRGARRARRADRARHRGRRHRRGALLPALRLPDAEGGARRVRPCDGLSGRAAYRRHPAARPDLVRPRAVTSGRAARRTRPPRPAPAAGDPSSPARARYCAPVTRPGGRHAHLDPAARPPAPHRRPRRRLRVRRRRRRLRTRPARSAIRATSRRRSPARSRTSPRRSTLRVARSPTSSG